MTFTAFLFQQATRNLLYDYSRKQASRVSSDFTVKSFRQGARVGTVDRGKVLRFPQWKLSNSVEAVSISSPFLILPHAKKCRMAGYSEQVRKSNIRTQSTATIAKECLWLYNEHCTTRCKSSATDLADVPQEHPHSPPSSSDANQTSQPSIFCHHRAHTSSL